MKGQSGWDGKLRVERKAVLADAEALSDDASEASGVEPVQIEADEGKGKQDLVWSVTDCHMQIYLILSRPMPKYYALCA